MSEDLFPAVCHRFARAVGKQRLIPSASLLESTRIHPMKVAIKKKKRKWVAFSKMEYCVHDIKIHELLLDKPTVELEMKEKNFCSYSHMKTFSVDAAVEADMMPDVMETSLHACNKITISDNLGQLVLREVKSPESFISDLSSRHIDIKHPLIEEVLADKDSVLCVVRSVIQTTDKAEIKRTDHADGSMKVSEKVVGSVAVAAGAGVESVRDIVIDKGIIVAYEVLELKVNTKDGSIVPVHTNNANGGFSYMDCIESTDELDGAYPENKNAIFDPEPLEDKLRPLLEMTAVDRRLLIRSLKTLMICSSDVVLLSKLLDRVDGGSLNEDKAALCEKFVYSKSVLSLLKLVGAQTEGDKIVVYKGETTPTMTAFAYVVDAMTEIRSEVLEELCRCTERELRTLSEVFKSAVRSNLPISVDTTVEETVSSILTDLEFTVYRDNNTILPPKTRTDVAECIFCILYVIT